MSKLNRTFQRLRREKRMNFTDISEKCNIPLKRVEELDNNSDFSNQELAKICDALGISLEQFIKESESTRMDSPYLIKVKIQGDPEESEMYDTICYIESERMNNVYDPICEGWKHNSFNEAIVVLENARNMLGFAFLKREGYLLAVLSSFNDHAYIAGKEVVHVSFGSDDDDYFLDDPFDDMDDFRYFDDDRY